MKQRKTLKNILLLSIVILACCPPRTALAGARSDNTTKLVGEYTLVSMAYNFLRSCGEANPKDGEKIEAIMLKKRENLFKKHRFSPAEKTEISRALPKLPKKIKKIDPYACHLSMDAAKKNLKIWLPSE